MKELSNDSLMRDLDELAAFEPNGFPFVSLYLNAQADQHGRDNFEPFVRKEFNNRARTFAEDSPERKSFERDAARIESYLRDELQPSANGVALFACAGACDYFKAIQLAAQINRHSLHVAPRPHLYPLARVIDQYPRYVALVADTNSARLFVFDLGKTESLDELNSPNTSRAEAGERSQLRYRRRMENERQLHAKEIVETLERVVREESAQHIVLAGDEVIIPLLCERMPPFLGDKVIDILRLDIRTPEHEVLRATMEALREDNIQTDAEKVRDLFDKYRAGGLAVVGLRDTLDALEQWQVDELLLSASLKDIRADERSLNEIPSVSAMSANTLAAAGAFITQIIEPGSAATTAAAAVADQLVAKARLNGAGVTFIEDRLLLKDVGGVGAFLRYRI
jgi:peptide subunit release factor 1 (eRF1)